ncbi:MAG: PorV/PorQ family protein [Candidatus Cloacimonadia bacterium]
MMAINKFFRFTLMIFLLFPAYTFGDSIEEYGFSILTIGTSPSIVGKGEAISAGYGDATVFWYNPAAPLLSSSSNFCASHTGYIFDLNIEHASVSIQGERRSYGLGMTYLDYGKIDKYNDNGQPTGEYHPVDIVIGGNFAHRFSSALYGGVNLKIVGEKIDTDNSMGAGVDVGILYDTPIIGLNFAAVVQNIGFSGEMNSERIEFPRTYKIGLGYVHHFASQSFAALMMDLVKSVGIDNPRLNLGLEYGFAEIAYTRLGYKINYDEHDFTAGIGIKLNDFHFDYAFVPYSSGLGSVHMISVAYDF